MKANNLLFVSNVDDVSNMAAEATEHTVQNYYLSALISVNLTTPASADEYVVLANPAKLHRIVETVGIVAALAVGAIIIIGVAFIMSKLRKIQSAAATGLSTTDQHLVTCEVVTVDNNALQQQQQQQIPHYDIKHVYSITGVIVSSPPQSRRSIKTVLVPNFLKRKPTEIASVHDALKKDLSRIYVY